MRTIVLLFSILYLLRAAQCPYGFEFISGECRGNYTRIDSFGEDIVNDVITSCEGILAQPIIIHTAEDQSYWSSRVAKSEWTVIGLLCNTTSKKWYWADGSPMDFKPDKHESALDNDCTTGKSWVIRTDGIWSYYSSSTSKLATDVFCTLPIRQLSPNEDGCDSFEDDNEDKVCYQVGAPAENWQEAQMICKSFGANVASIHNEKENSFVRRLAVSKGAVSGMYLGASLAGKGNEFGWIDGSAWDYDNFYPGFPVSGLGECLLLDTGGTTGDWANVDCSSKLSVACMRPQHYVPPECSAGPWQEGQIIYSPGFPSNASTPCDFILSVDVGKRVEVEILLLEANPCCDHLVVYENYFGSNIIANLTGQISDKTYATGSSNYMRVSWQPNGGVNVRGMMMTYRSL